MTPQFRPLSDSDLAAALRTADLPLVLADPYRLGQPIVFANAAFQRLTGYSPGEAIGRPCQFLLNSFGSVVDRDVISRAMRERKGVRTELLCYRRDGSPFWNELWFGPVCDDAGVLIYFLAVHQDVTARRDLDDAIGADERTALAQTEVEHAERQHEQEASTAEREKLEVALQLAATESALRARLMATAGHDLKQPLQAAVMLLDSVRRKADPSSSERLTQALGMLTRLGNELDALAQASRAGLAFVPQRAAFSIGDLLRKLAPQWREHAAALGIDLRVRFSDLQVVSDQAMLSTILSNLIGNALKFTARGGRVLVGCRLRAGMLSMVVLDTGCGIAANKLAVIFEEFHRIEPVDARDGLGLGLSIVKRTAEALGHELRVSSVPGRGSCFGVDVPLASSSSPFDNRHPQA